MMSEVLPRKIHHSLYENDDDWLVWNVSAPALFPYYVLRMARWTVWEVMHCYLRSLRVRGSLVVQGIVMAPLEGV